MTKLALALSALLLAAPVAAQIVQPVPNLLEQQRQDINSGRYGMTYEQQQRIMQREPEPYRGAARIPNGYGNQQQNNSNPYLLKPYRY